ncbi:hypothetical protein U9M48_034337 [Paspalum notatum var. saurae]|uniref:FBD domain-containing protein n=1 Tax=Paspalum notatum var. saurae TaxID=547442 RepID=A0AAQ3X7V4_PASNO
MEFVNFVFLNMLASMFQAQESVKGGISVFTNLRHLALSVGIDGCPQTGTGILQLACLLGLAPVLEELEIHMYCRQTPFYNHNLDETAPQHLYKHLKAVHMTGFYAIRGQLELARHILRSAVSLERMIIDPKDILRDILSRLTLKEAVRMSILSKKCKRIWKHHPKLVFTRTTMRSRNSAMAGHQRPFRTRFIRGVNSVLRQLKSADLCKFVVKFGLRERHTRHINRWVNFSAASRAKHVVFDLCAGPKGSADTDNRYSFPLDMFNASGGSCVKHLCLGFVSLTMPPDFCGFKHLKKLSLDKVVIAGELQCLFPECSVLEWLSITLCKLVGLTISQHLSRLFFLRVKYCNLQELNVHAPNLSTFEFAANLIPSIVLGELLNISEATIYLFSCLDCFDYVFSKLLNNGFSHVQSLTINLTIKTEVCSLDNETGIFAVQGFVKNPFRMTFLRRVVLKVDISGWSGSSAGILRLAYLLELAPILEELVLNMCCFATPLYIWELNEDGFTPCPHRHLKTVHMTGFYGYHGQLQLALYILRNATCLERLIIDPMVKNNSFIPPQKPDDGDIDIGRRSARHHLFRKGFGKVLQIL